MLAGEELKNYFFDGAELLMGSRMDNPVACDYKLIIGFQSLTISHKNDGELAALDDHGVASREVLSGFFQQLPNGTFALDIMYDETLGIPLTVHCNSKTDRKRDETVSRLVMGETPYGPDNTLSFWTQYPDMSLQAIILPRDVMERILLAMQDQGITIGRMGIFGKDRMQGHLHSFWWTGQPQANADLSFTDRASAFFSTIAPAYKALAAAILLAVLSVYSNLAYLNFQTSSGTAEVQQARRALASRAARWNDANAFLAQQKGSLAQVALLNNIAGTLDDGSWLTRYRSNERAIEVTGLSKSAADVLDALAFINEVENVRLLSGVVRDQNAGIERFRIGFDLQVSR